MLNKALAKKVGFGLFIGWDNPADYRKHKKGSPCGLPDVKSMTNYFAEDLFFITTMKRAAASSTRLPPMMVNIRVPLPPVAGSLA